MGGGGGGNARHITNKNFKSHRKKPAGVKFDVFASRDSDAYYPKEAGRGQSGGHNKRTITSCDDIMLKGDPLFICLFKPPLALFNPDSR